MPELYGFGVNYCHDLFRGKKNFSRNAFFVHWVKIHIKMLIWTVEKYALQKAAHPAFCYTNNKELIFSHGAHKLIYLTWTCH